METADVLYEQCRQEDLYFLTRLRMMILPILVCSSSLPNMSA